jgi:hypothetical protein
VAHGTVGKKTTRKREISRIVALAVENEREMTCGRGPTQEGILLEAHHAVGHHMTMKKKRSQIAMLNLRHNQPALHINTQSNHKVHLSDDLISKLTSLTEAATLWTMI